MTENDVNPPINHDPMEKRNKFIDHPSYLQSDRQIKKKKNKFTFQMVELNDCSEQNNEMSVLLACYVVSYDTFCHKTTCGVF